MKWPTTRSSSFHRFFPVSWFFKSKQKGDKFAAVKSKEGRFYSMDEDDFFWRLSFGDERIPARKSTGGISNRSDEECRNFNEMVLDIKRMRESRGKQRKTEESRGKQRKTGDSSRKRNQISRKSRGFDDEQEKVSNLQDLNYRTSRKSRGFDDKEEKISTLQERFSNSVSDWLEIEGGKLKEIKIKSDSRTNKNPTKMVIKSHSPRTECKIRALEDIKKSRSRSRLKTRKKKEQVLEENTIFDSFAVVKSSYNPQKDFRESMVEMIRERGIESAEDLEDLLACYLTLNCDDYHDLIIKVFRQVWFELKGVYVDPYVKNCSYFDHGID